VGHMPSDLVGVAGFEPAASSSRIRPWKADDLWTLPKMQVRALVCVGLAWCSEAAISRSSPGFLHRPSSHTGQHDRPPVPGQQLSVCHDTDAASTQDEHWRSLDRLRALHRQAGQVRARCPRSARTPGRNRDADVDPKIRRRTVGDADQAMTSHYTFVEAEAHRAAADVAALIEGQGSDPAPPCSPFPRGGS
jgi:hypothetical protein